MTREEQIDKTRVEVLRLKQKGLEVREIALETAIKKSYIIKILKYQQKIKRKGK
ncbi:hypothetical protein [uncultured Clostridium sp.]|uniref:hypothetical protein n=1 Tax=uncultured Clostridium sp. TaxID=59620 RepID=UPI0026016D1A|nr:hypothetical protein [uncultured Clostridium sp.]